MTLSWLSTSEKHSQMSLNVSCLVLLSVVVLLFPAVLTISTSSALVVRNQRVIVRVVIIQYVSHLEGSTIL